MKFARAGVLHGVRLVCLASALGFVDAGCHSGDTAGPKGGTAGSTAGLAAISGGESGTTAAGGTAALGGTALPASGSVAAGNRAAAGSSGMSGNVASAGSTAGNAANGGCGSESFAAIYREIFAKPVYSCNAAICHGRTDALTDLGNLDMSTPAATYAALVGKPSDGMMCAGKLRVKAGDAQNSLLVRKLRDATVECGMVMPAGSEAITDPELQRIVTWINAGACNN
jgi:hypothetical protein